MTSYHGWTHAPKEMGGTDPIPFTGAIYHFVVFEDDVPVVSGDGAFIFHIPADLDGMRLAEVEINVETASSSGIVQVQIHNITQAVDMLSTRVQVDANELHSKDAATAAVVNAANAVVSHGDRIRVDVDAAGTGAVGLDVVLRFYTAAGFSLRGPTGVQGETGATGATGPQGPQGDPGGIVAWEGEWSSATTYVADDAVSWNGSSYVAIQGSTDVEPGVDSGWEDYWMVLAAAGAAGEAGVAADGWVADGDVWTYASATTFTVSGDQTAKFSKGTRIKLTQTTVKYFVVVASSYSDPTTTVTITGGSDYTLANATIDDPSYSYMANPQGFPVAFAYTPSEVGWSSTTVLTGRFYVVGSRCFCRIVVSGTSDTTNVQLGLPIAAGTTTIGAQGLHFGARVTNSGATDADDGMGEILTGGTSAIFYRDWTGAAWTASGTKAVGADFVYEI